MTAPADGSAAPTDRAYSERGITVNSGFLNGSLDVKEVYGEALVPLAKDMPFAKSLDPVTKTNWEGTGVAPDVKVPATDALETAEKLALEKIQAKKDSK